MAGFGVFEGVLDHAIYAAAARTAFEAGAQVREILDIAGRNHFHIAILGVAHPAAQFQLAGFALHEPAKTYALHSALNEKVENHRQGQFGKLGVGCATRKSRRMRETAKARVDSRSF